MMIHCILALTLLAADDVPEPGRVMLAGGDRLSGRVSAITSDGEMHLRGELVGDVKARLADVTRIEMSTERVRRAEESINEARQAAPEARAFVAGGSDIQKTVFADGSVVTGEVASIRESTTKLTGTPVGELSAETSQLAAVVFSGACPSAGSEAHASRLHFTNGDDLNFQRLSLNNSEVSIRTFFGKTSVATDRVSCIVVAIDDGAVNESEGIAEVVLINGDRLRGDVGLFDRRGLRLQTNWAGEVVVPRNLIAWIDFADGREKEPR